MYESQLSRCWCARCYLFFDLRYFLDWLITHSFDDCSSNRRLKVGIISQRSRKRVCPWSLYGLIPWTIEADQTRDDQEDCLICNYRIANMASGQRGDVENIFTDNGLRMGLIQGTTGNELDKTLLRCTECIEWWSRSHKYYVIFKGALQTEDIRHVYGTSWATLGTSSFVCSLNLYFSISASRRVSVPV